MNDRIKLAEAMGWTSAGDPDGNLWWSQQPAKYPESYCFETNELPDPFTDANDDYVVLDWMRNHKDFWKFQQELDEIQWSYQIGDYARAALKVINE